MMTKIRKIIKYKNINITSKVFDSTKIYMNNRKSASLNEIEKFILNEYEEITNNETSTKNLLCSWINKKVEFINENKSI